MNIYDFCIFLKWINSKKTDIVVIGLCTEDNFIDIKEFPIENNKYECQINKKNCGGTAANITINLNTLDIQSKLISWVGDDCTGCRILKQLRASGISVDGIVQSSGDSQNVFILSNIKMNSRTAFLLKSSRPNCLTHKQKKLIEKSRIIYYDGSWPEINNTLIDYINNPHKILFMNYEIPSHQNDLIFKKANYGIISTQVMGLSDKNDLQKIKKRISKIKTDCHIWIGTTLGEKGSIFYDGKSFYIAPPIQIDVVETTGAGDAFFSGFLFGAISGWNIEKTLELSTYIGSLKCKLKGSNLSGITSLDIENAYKTNNIIYKEKIN